MSGAEDERLVELATVIHRDLAESRRASVGSGRRDVTVEQAIRHAVAERASVLAEQTREELAERISRDTIGLGPLEELLDDPEVEEVMVNGGGEVYVERSGRIEPVDAGFAGEEELRNTIERILAPLGRRVDELSPMVDARLADGSQAGATSLRPMVRRARRIRSASSSRRAGSGECSALEKSRSDSLRIGTRCTWQCGTSSPAMSDPTRTGSNAAIRARPSTICALASFAQSSSSRSVQRSICLTGTTSR